MNAYGAAIAAAILCGRWIVERSEGRTIRARWPVLLTFLLFATSVAQSFVVAVDPLRLASEVGQWVLGLLLFVAVSQERDKRLPAHVEWAFVVGAIMLAICQLFARALEVELTDDLNTVFLRSDSNNYASFYYLLGMVLLPLSRFARIPTYVCVLLVCAGLALILANDSRAQFVSAVVAIAYFFFSRTSARTMIVSAVFGVASAVLLLGVPAISDLLFDSGSVLSLLNFQTNYSNLERLGLILYSFELFFANPFGYGIGSSSMLFPSASLTLGSYPTPHNTLAMLMVEGGIIGVVAYFLLAGFLFRVIFRGLSGTATGGPLAIGLLLATVFEAVFFNGVVATVFWLTLALLNRSSASPSSGVFVCVRVTGAPKCAESPA